MLIVFEGGEGSGKTTQVRMLVDSLDRAGLPVTVTREPGGTDVGRRIRDLVLDARLTMPSKTETLLYLADRAVHVDQVIRPALDAGRVVVCDRFTDSTIVYQGVGRGLGMGYLAGLCGWVTDHIRPDLTVLLDIDPHIGLGRARRRGPVNRLELDPMSFHERVRDGFRSLAEARNHAAGSGPKPYLIIDAGRDPDSIAAEVVSAVSERLPTRVRA